MMKKVLYLILISVSVSCGGESPDPDTFVKDPLQPGENLSVNGKIEYIGSVPMEEGPHDLLIDGSDLYAVRDHKVFQFQITNPARPALQNQYVLSNATGRFGKLYASAGKLYLPCQTDGQLYELNTDLSLSRKYDLSGIASFRPNIMVTDEFGNFWVGGSNGSNGVLARYIPVSGSLALEGYWISDKNESNIEGVVSFGAHIIVSTANGELMSFEKRDAKLSMSLTYENEPGHEKWGRTVITHGNTAYWANWGAGLASIHIFRPQLMELLSVLTNSGFKSQFPGAEGTNVYDVVYNEKWKVLCIANGWSGVVLARPDDPSQVVDYIDPEYFQNRCIESKGDYIYTGNISGGMSGNMKGLKVFKRVK